MRRVIVAGGGSAAVLFRELDEAFRGDRRAAPRLGRCEDRVRQAELLAEFAASASPLQMRRLASWYTKASPARPQSAFCVQCVSTIAELTAGSRRSSGRAIPPAGLRGRAEASLGQAGEVTSRRYLESPRTTRCPRGSGRGAETAREDDRYYLPIRIQTDGLRPAVRHAPHPDPPGDGARGRPLADNRVGPGAGALRRAALNRVQRETVALVYGGSARGILPREPCRASGSGEVPIRSEHPHGRPAVSVRAADRRQRGRSVTCPP